jgi:Predicted SAM-dependent methyltransferase
MQLKGRLLAIAEKIPQCYILADIGTDHAYIPVYAIKKRICRKAIASDVKKGPVEIAIRNIRRYGFTELIDTRLGSGIDTLKDDELDVIVIAGMGGILIQEIMCNNLEKSKMTGMFILQPMNCVEDLRKWLYENGFDIIEETLAEETIKVYNILIARWDGKVRYVDEFSCFIGLKLLERKDDIFRKYVGKKLGIIEKKISGMKKANEKSPLLNHLIDMRDRLIGLIKDMQL